MLFIQGYMALFAWGIKVKAKENPFWAEQRDRVCQTAHKRKENVSTWNNRPVLLIVTQGRG